ncbi:hypothetical protein A3F37_00930 [Candidatus Saccharibacteria bacterium RIFCSPHIGHO2_12_FULL_41_12]|nr:MAG: hypothetical protein A3F37_00930 [Candidatus Saccharibacteria bacterium RIFCSPHIGHO2_12_FULL_41_12]
MQEDIISSDKKIEKIMNNIPVVPAPTQPPQQPSNTTVMDIKKPEVQQKKPEDNSAKQSKKQAPTKNKPHPNMGVIIFACLICALLVSLAIYIQMKSPEASSAIQN